MIRRRALGAGMAALCVAVTMAAGCSPNPDAGSDAGGTLIVARTGDVDLLDPSRATAFQTVQTMGLVYDTLLDTDDDGKLVPSLATKWDTSDPKKITFTLRDDVTFHNGEKFTAADAEATLTRNLDPKTGSVVTSTIGSISAVKATGDHTLVIDLKQPDTALLTALTYTGNSILSKADIDAGRVGKKVNGTGAFRWKKWKQGQKLTLTGNKNYWDGAPKLAGVEFRVIPD
ncbi:MAG: ABC transporter substrate-binding protein, partial [Micromonosporaceae bacterium]